VEKCFVGDYDIEVRYWYTNTGLFSWSLGVIRSSVNVFCLIQVTLRAKLNMENSSHIETYPVNCPIYV